MIELTGLRAIFDTVERATENSVAASESGELSKLYEEAKRQEIELYMAEMQAKVIKGLAIAERIKTAHSVEIEEYYEGSGKGKLLLKMGSLMWGWLVKVRK